MKFTFVTFVTVITTLGLASIANARVIQTDGPAKPNSNEEDSPPGFDTSRMIIAFKNGHGKAAAEAAASKVHHRLDKQNAVAASIPPQAMQGLLKNPNIEYVEMDAPRYLLGNKHASANLRGGSIGRSKQRPSRQLVEETPYGIPIVQADQLSPSPNPKKICIIDSGFATTHPDFKSNLDAGSWSVDGYSGQSNLPWNVDKDGHGKLTLYSIYSFAISQ